MEGGNRNAGGNGHVNANAHPNGRPPTPNGKQPTPPLQNPLPSPQHQNRSVRNSPVNSHSSARTWHLNEDDHDDLQFGYGGNDLEEENEEYDEDGDHSVNYGGWDEGDDEYVNYQQPNGDPRDDRNRYLNRNLWDDYPRNMNQKGRSP
ncbi:hypothetical protein L1987_24195 [Smallanthus sonchifolius]|uniref:Uncharacterized protein n=1 Tax=Smallanthus sonchifolius TaxID=185202 RepID=A0ACB9IL90_9ASTR|nr:hypothetical protein L1987_24195 [Smallanthus sonchifolius]